MEGKDQVDVVDSWQFDGFGLLEDQAGQDITSGRTARSVYEHWARSIEAPKIWYAGYELLGLLESMKGRHCF